MILRRVIPAARLCCNYYVTTAPAVNATPPMLLKIRKDMKAAMQTKDSNRLSVLRSLMSQTLNASKTSTPITTDIQMLALLRKTANASRIAKDEFKSAGRQDLVDKEDSQLKILEEYAGSVEILDEKHILAAVIEVVGRVREDMGKVQIGEVLKRVFAPDVLGQKPVDRGEVAKIVKRVLDSS